MINLSKLAAVAKAASKTKAAPAPSLTKLDQERLTRRAALRRIGMTSGVAVLGLLTIDDLARVASQKLEQNELTRGIAKDFQSAGVAFADTLAGGYYMGGRPRRPRPVPPQCTEHNANASACKDALHRECLIQRSRNPGSCTFIMNACQQEAGIADADAAALVECYRRNGVV